MRPAGSPVQVLGFVVVAANERAVAEEVVTEVLSPRITPLAGQLEQLPRQRLGTADLALGHEQLADTAERAHLAEPVARGAPKLETLLEAASDGRL